MRNFSLCGLLTGALLTVGTLGAQAQAPTSIPRPCGTDKAMREALGAGYESWWQDYQQQLQALSRNPPGSPPVGPRFIVPVVMHIIHDNGGSNISDAQVYDAVRILNEVFQELDPDTAQVIPYFKSRIGNPNLEFRLAKLDPQGNCTNGITRHFSPLTHSAGENVKSLPGASWPGQRYLNVWIVEDIASGAAGYSYLPCGVGPSTEGIVIRNDYFGSIGRTPNFQYNRHAFPHEVGHYLGLPHTWGGTNTPGSAANCNDDDGVSDTPNTTGYSFQCNVNSPSCPGDPDPLSNVQNIMDYAGCPSMFTQGQALVMNGGVASRFACRTLLVSASNLQFTGTADGQVIPPCLPIAYLAAAGAGASLPVQRICQGDSLSFRASVYNIAPGSPVTYQWSFPGGQPSTSTVENPFVLYPTGGTFDVRLRVTSTTGTDSTARTGYVMARSTTSGAVTPQIELFEDAAFPANSSDPQKNWEITPTSGTRWEYTNLSAGQGASSVRLRLQNTVRGNDYDLISPNIVISTTVPRSYLYFRRAYAQRSTGSVDKLTVSFSTDCGRTWITRGNTGVRVGVNLATASPMGGSFVPNASQWRQDSVLIQTQPLLAGSHIMVRFRATSDIGNSLYLDDIRLGSPLTGLGAELGQPVALSIFPNPSDGDETTLRLTTSAAGSATVRVFDATGRLLGQPWHLSSATPGTTHEVRLTEVAGKLAAGVYMVELSTANGTRRTQRALVY